MTTPQLTSRLRGGGCGVLVGGLAVAAHGIGGGGVPKSAELALLLLVSLTAGIFAADVTAECAGPRTHSYRRPATLRTAAALIGGQWAGHFALSATLDHHGLLHLPSLPMIAAHLVAAGACAALILVAERLYLVASSVIRAVLSSPAALAHRAVRWFAAVAVARGARPKGARCPRAPPLFA
ncbi:hypothetical protein [Nocardia salmonicida]|uniref:hypothetical protein n=1 Tax=Nocardia salmonicida TaxID=53431 RepID=UPI0007A438B5|nr:hypothetical protein [Nocardia salmonicida]